MHYMKHIHLTSILYKSGRSNIKKWLLSSLPPGDENLIIRWTLIVFLWPSVLILKRMLTTEMLILLTEEDGSGKREEG